MKSGSAAAAFLAASLTLPAGAANAADPTGLWLTDDGAAKIRVVRCGARLCGTVAWLKNPNDGSGKPQLDTDNADVSKRNRPIIGVPIILSMKPHGQGKWSGRIYNAEDGKTYDGNVTLLGNTLKVQGCVTVFCRTKTWTRTN